MRGWGNRLSDMVTGERYAAARKQARATIGKVLRSPLGAGGLAIIVLFVAMAALAPVIAGDFPNYATRANVCIPNLPPGENGFAYEVEADTYVSTAAVSGVFGDEEELRISRTTTSIEATLLSFSFSLCPGDQVRRANLRLAVRSAEGTEWPVTLSVGRLLATISEANASWKTVPPNLRDTPTTQTVPTRPAPGEDLVVDVTEQVRRWQADGQRVEFGAVLRFRYPTDAVLSLASRENTSFEPATLEAVIDSGFPLGTDIFGRSIFALLVYGAQVSLIIGFTSSIIAIVIGALVGVVAGYYGGGWDQVFSRLTDFFLVIPWLPFVLVLAAVMGRGFETTVIAIAIVSWPTTARVVRSKVLSVKTLAYVERARAIGAGDGRIMIRHVMPVLGPLIFANMILTVSTSIFTESFLAFFGLGDIARPSWGTMIENAFRGGSFFRGQFWYVLPPGVCITALVLAFTMVSYSLEEVLNPKLRRR